MSLIQNFQCTVQVGFLILAFEMIKFYSYLIVILIKI